MKQDTLAPVYSFDGNTFSSIRINEVGSGVISIYSQSATTLVTAIFNNITAFNIKSATGITQLEGGVLYAKNLK